MRAADGHTPAAAAAAAAGEPGSDVRGEQPRQKCVYVEPPRRVKEILEEHFHLQEEECNVNNPTAGLYNMDLQQAQYRNVALEGVWNVKNNFSIKSLKPVSQNNSDLLLQPQFYSRHARMKTYSPKKFNCLEKHSSSTPPEKSLIQIAECQCFEDLRLL